MDAIDLMVAEHQNIKRGLRLIRQLCLNILNTGEVRQEEFHTLIDFVRNYADKHHHSKEEDILFRKMTEVIGEDAKGPLSGMYIEHEFGRLFIRRLDEALAKVKEGDKDARVDVIANAIAYTDLLANHIDKEDQVMYQFARRELNEGEIGQVNEESQRVEKLAQEKKLQENYLHALDRLEEHLLAGVSHA